jgi:predicted ATPase
MSENQKHISHRKKVPTINKISVSGYKSIGAECTIEFKPLTVLAGVNSSGKSSIFQPLLLLKQTLEASYDPGALRLSGSNVRYSSGEQLLCKFPSQVGLDQFSISMCLSNDKQWVCYYKWVREKGFDLAKMVYAVSGTTHDVTPGRSRFDPGEFFPKDVPKGFFEANNLKWAIVRDRCFAEMQGQRVDTKSLEIKVPFTSDLAEVIRGIIHLPGLRGNPERTYPVTAVGDTFPGTFHEYTASIIAAWKAKDNKEKLKDLGNDLLRLGLTWMVDSFPQNDTQVEIKVARLPHEIAGRAYDLVSIADVGLGVSQILPVLVALHAAKPGQIVYLEQPEIHLHPRAQMALAEVLAAAANRDMILVVETHSSILLRGIQTAVAQGKLSADKVSLNWFKRNENSGQTECIAGQLDKSGAFGDWPEDFDEITLESEKNFLDANETSLK